jgi:hypothetical protein
MKVTKGAETPVNVSNLASSDKTSCNLSGAPIEYRFSFFLYEVMQLKFVDHLNKEQKQQLERLKKLQKEKLSPRDLDDLMGTKQQTYKRRHGAVTNK